MATWRMYGQVLLTDLGESCRSSGYQLTQEDKELLTRSLQDAHEAGVFGMGVGFTSSLFLLHRRLRQPKSLAEGVGLMFGLLSMTTLGQFVGHAYGAPKAVEYIANSDTRLGTETVCLLKERFPNHPYTRSLSLDGRHAPRIRQPAPSFAASAVPAAEDDVAAHDADLARDAPAAAAAQPRDPAQASNRRQAQPEQGQQQHSHIPRRHGRQTVGEAEGGDATEHVWTDEFPPEIPVTADEWSPHDEDIMAGMGDTAVKDEARPRRTQRRASTQDMQPVLSDGWKEAAGSDADGQPHAEHSPEASSRRGRRFDRTTHTATDQTAPAGVARRSRRVVVDPSEGPAAEAEPTADNAQRRFKLATAQSQSEHVWDDSFDGSRAGR